MSESGTIVASSACIEHLRWSLASEVGPILFGRIVERFGSAQGALGAGAGQLREVEGIGPTLAEEIARTRDQADVAGEVALAERYGVRILCREDQEYPQALQHIPDPPICLYVRGILHKNDALAVAIVGARRCTIYGREQAYRFGYQLASRGVTVVSGLARGIDGESHKGALAAKGRTIAVMGNGLASVYPPEHEKLADQIAENGALVSELAMEYSPQSTNFLPRNRLIAGLSLGVLVIEAARRSGSLATARLAGEYNREVYALPGRIDSDFSLGTNKLIRDQHAKLAMNTDDIINELGSVGEALQPAEEKGQTDTPTLFDARSSLNNDEELIYDSLDHEERSIEAIAEATSLPVSKVASTLISLQLKNMVRQLPGNVFVRNKKR
ncbi:MAG: DNA-processing protein DprA [Planctomycetota bacterium]|jgi:DNA processing protein